MILFGINCAFISIFAISCTGIPATNSGNPDIGTGSSGQASAGRTRTASGPLFTGTGGKGLVIAVPAPSMPGGSQTNSWMPQLFQDLITADLARYSAMTVLDRLNESLVLAEQQISASGNYSDDDYIAMGRLTNARYIVAGNILGVSGRYSITF
jgi:TolB-like protein